MKKNNPKIPPALLEGWRQAKEGKLHPSPRDFSLVPERTDAPQKTGGPETAENSRTGERAFPKSENRSGLTNEEEPK